MTSMEAYSASYSAALERLRREQPDAAKAAFLDADFNDALDRFITGEEFRATVRLLKDLGMVPPARLVDVGAGNGIASCAFATEGFRVTAVEPCSMDNYGADFITHMSKTLNKPIDVQRSCAETMPLESGSCDVAYARAALHHANDLEQAIAEAARVLKSGGVFLALREHVASNERELRLFRARNPMSQYGIQENAYPLNRYVSAIESAGLRVLQIYGPHDFPLNLDRPSIRIALRPLRERISSVFGAAAAARVVAACEKLVTRRWTGMVLNAVRRLPGRLCTFAARKE